MGHNIPFRRRTLSALIAAACGVVPLGAGAAVNAAKVDFSIGNVTATGPDGQQRSLSKGAAVGVGDTIDTNTGRAWLRFKDGGYMSLQPGTEFRVDDYNFKDEDDGSEKSFFSLLRGGMRAITGAIGKRNRAAYRVQTPVGTIGIRGTEYLATLGNSLTISCGEGICIVTNDAGEIELSAGQTAYIKNQQSSGERVTRKVVLPPNPPVIFAGGEFRDSDGDLGVLIPPPSPEEPAFIFSEDVPLVAGEQPGLMMGLSYAGEGGGPFAFDLTHDARVDGGTAPDYVTGTFSEDLGLLLAQWNFDEVEDSFLDQILFDDPEFDNTLEDLDTDGVIAWGRWTGEFINGTVFENGFLDLDSCCSPDQGNVHYFTGVPTPEGDLVQLASQNTVAVYNLIGATIPTFGDDGFEGSIDFGDPVAISGALAANFGAGTVQTSLVIDYTDNDLSINSGAMPIAAGAGGVFGGSGAWATSPLDSEATYNTKIQGFFVGGAASRAGYAYDVLIDSFDTYPINGVVVFGQGGTAQVIPVPPPAPPPETL